MDYSERPKEIEGTIGRLFTDGDPPYGIAVAVLFGFTFKVKFILPLDTRSETPSVGETVIFTDLTWPGKLGEHILAGSVEKLASEGEIPAGRFILRIPDYEPWPSIAKILMNKMGMSGREVMTEAFFLLAKRQGGFLFHAMMPGLMGSLGQDEIGVYARALGVLSEREFGTDLSK